jgi:phosphatidylinositol alpha 1,6-mannosyltransferase
VPHRQLFVGEGPERAKLQAKLPNAVFTGFLDGDALSSAYASADVFFFPSVTETFGIVTLEAMASGLPAVCANATGSASLVLPGETGYLIDDKDNAGFADAIGRLVQDAGLRRGMGEKAVARSREYSWRRAMETLEGYYYEVLATSRSTST